MTSGGTYGQFIPGVTPGEGIGLGDRPLQVLQLEQSDRFRSNLGLAELTGNPVKVRLQLDLPDSLVTPTQTGPVALGDLPRIDQGAAEPLAEGAAAGRGDSPVEHGKEGAPSPSRS